MRGLGQWRSPGRRDEEEEEEGGGTVKKRNVDRQGGKDKCGKDGVRNSSVTKM